jgi:ferredoxin
MTQNDDDSTAGVLSTDVHTCIGAGNCVELAEEYFDQSEDDATVILRKPDVSAGDVARVQRAVTVCPVGAITFTKRGP